jgi:hypothetical protein
MFVRGASIVLVSLLLWADRQAEAQCPKLAFGTRSLVCLSQKSLSLRLLAEAISVERSLIEFISNAHADLARSPKSVLT